MLYICGVPHGWHAIREQWTLFCTYSIPKLCGNETSVCTVLKLHSPWTASWRLFRARPRTSCKCCRPSHTWCAILSKCFPGCHPEKKRWTLETSNSHTGGMAQSSCRLRDALYICAPLLFCVLSLLQNDRKKAHALKSGWLPTSHKVCSAVYLCIFILPVCRAPCSISV